MNVQDWIQAANLVGWHVKSSCDGDMLTLVCQVPGCPGVLRRSPADLGPVPVSCDLDHIDGHSPHLWDEYKGLVDQMRQRRRALGLDQIDVNNAMGMTDGYVSKLEAMHRIPRPAVLQLWAQTLGLRLALESDELPQATRDIIKAKRSHADKDREQTESEG